MKIIYLIKHSGPFVDIDNYSDYNNVLWEEYNRNMILSIDGEKNAEKLSDAEELKNIDDIYASNSVRAIGTAKYIADKNNLKIKLDDRINERVFGIDYLRQLPADFNKISFDDKNFKLENGESLNEVDKRFNSFITELLKGNKNKIVIVLHGIILLSYLKTICDFKFDGKQFNILYNEKVILDGNPKNPDVYKITYDKNCCVLNVEHLNNN